MQGIEGSWAVDYKGNSPLDYVCMRKDEDPSTLAAVKLLLSHHSLPKEPTAKPTALHYSCSLGHSKKVQLLVQDGGWDASHEDFWGRNALHYAACSPSPYAVVPFLLSIISLDPRCKDKRGYSAVHLAIKSRGPGRVQAVSLLLAADRSLVNDIDGENLNKPLHFAAIHNDVKLTAVLLAQGGWVDAENKFGMTPLHYAAMKGAKDVAEYLILKGADVDAVNQRRQVRALL